MLALRNLVNHFGEHYAAVSNQLLVLITARLIAQESKDDCLLEDLLNVHHHLALCCHF